MQAPQRPDNDDHIFSDDTSTEDTVERGEVPFNRLILKTSLIGLGITAFLVVAAAIATSAAPPNSIVENLAATLYRFFTMLMLVAFVGIFFAYQFPKLLKLTWFNETSLKAEIAKDPTMPDADAMQPALNNRKRILNSDLLILGSCNFGFLMFLWLLGGIFYGLGIIDYFPLAFFTILFMLPGLLITMVVWHQGAVRAYAIGVLPALLGLYFFGTTVQIYFFSNGFYRGSTQSSAGFMLGEGIGITLAALSGMCCAVYVRMVEVARTRTARYVVVDTAAEAK